MEKIKQFWANLPAERKRQIVLGAGCAFFVTVLWQFLSGEEIDRQGYTAPSSVRLTGDNVERLGMDAINARLRRMENQNEEMTDNLQRLREERDEALESAEPPEIHADYERQIQRLHERINRQQQELRQQGLQVSSEDDESREEDSDELDASAELLGEQEGSASEEEEDLQAQQLKERERKLQELESLWEDESRFQADARSGSGEGEQAPAAPKASINVITDSEKDQAAKDSVDADEPASQYLPAGSILSGTLITGLDAPTSQRSRSEPHPVLVRIKDESILPNRYRADFRECFLIVSGYGDMSSERAYLRTETMSCINDEGQAMETRLESFAVGEDGSAGVRGRLVRRTGQMIARATMASFISAASDVFSATPVPTIQTGESERLPFQQALSSEAAQSSALSGTGEAMNRIADYYMDMADSIFPIIEIDAGREIELIVNNGTEISFRN